MWQVWRRVRPPYRRTCDHLGFSFATRPARPAPTRNGLTKTWTHTAVHGRCSRWLLQGLNVQRIHEQSGRTERAGGASMSDSAGLGPWGEHGPEAALPAPSVQAI